MMSPGASGTARNGMPSAPIIGAALDGVPAGTVGAGRPREVTTPTASAATASVATAPAATARRRFVCVTLAATPAAEVGGGAEVVGVGGQLVAQVGEVHRTRSSSEVGARVGSMRSLASARLAWLFTVPTEHCMISAVSTSERSS